MIEVNYNEYKETIAENMKLIIENHDLKEKIKKAIEYITYKSVLDEKGLELNLCDKQIEKLLDILKGVDKE